MSKSDDLLNEWLVKGLVDSRKLAAVANARSLPNGEYGFCLMCLNGSTLNLCDINIRSEVGPQLYSIDLKKVSNLKTSTFIFNSYIKFTYEGFPYKLINCVHKALYRAIKEEAAR